MATAGDVSFQRCCRFVVRDRTTRMSTAAPTPMAKPTTMATSDGVEMSRFSNDARDPWVTSAPPGAAEVALADGEGVPPELTAAEAEGETVLAGTREVVEVGTCDADAEMDVGTAGEVDVVAEVTAEVTAELLPNPAPVMLLGDGVCVYVYVAVVVKLMDGAGDSETARDGTCERDGDAVDGDVADDGAGDGAGDAGGNERVMFTLKPPKGGSLDSVSVWNMMYTRAPGVVDSKGPGRLALWFPVRTMGLGGGVEPGSRNSTTASYPASTSKRVKSSRTVKPGSGVMIQSQ